MTHLRGAIVSTALPIQHPTTITACHAGIQARFHGLEALVTPQGTGQAVRARPSKTVCLGWPDNPNELVKHDAPGQARALQRMTSPESLLQAWA